MWVLKVLINDRFISRLNEVKMIILTYNKNYKALWYKKNFTCHKKTLFSYDKSDIIK